MYMLQMGACIVGRLVEATWNILSRASEVGSPSKKVKGQVKVKGQGQGQTKFKA